MRIGTDLCNPKRIEKTYQDFGEKFLDRVLTASEKEYVLSSKHQMISRLAARYAAKEAVAKLLGVGIGEKVSFKDITISKNGDAPEVELSGTALELAQELGLKDFAISISHEDILVMATVIAS